MAFFKVDNRIFSFGLKPRDLAVYFCLCRHADNKSGTVLLLETVYRSLSILHGGKYHK